MILIPHIAHQFNGIIWRMEIDPVSATLFAEIRNEKDKQVSFASVNLETGMINFDQLITEERWLTGIEAAYNGVLLLHGYESAGSPAHKGLIAVDGSTGNLLWQNYNYAFSHLNTQGAVVFDTRMQPRRFFITDMVTGSTQKPYNPAINEDIDTRIVVPDMVNVDMPDNTLPEQPFGNIIHNLYHNRYRIVSLHAQKDDTLNQSLYIFENNRPVFHDLLNTGIQKLQPEAFVLHNNHLIYLKNKVELKVINL